MSIWAYLFILCLVCYLLFEYIRWVKKNLKEIMKDYKELKKMEEGFKNDLTEFLKRKKDEQNN